MSQQKQAPLPRQEFQEWLENAAVPVLVLQKGKHLGSVVKVPATPEIDYLFGCETFYGERISWSDRLEFCGLYDRQHQALHLLDDPLPNFVSGLTEEECQDSTAFGKRIAQEVDRYVEAAISNERSRLSVRELTSERNINSYRYYKGTEAGREAASLVFSGEKPDVQFHSEYYTSLTEDTLLSYLKSPEDYIKTTAEQYMRDNQEEFLAQFLKKDALLAEYQMLSQDSDAPVYRMRAITDALQKSGAKTVNVTVQKDGVELTFKTSAESLKGLKSQYSTWYIAPSDRLQFRHLFGAGSDYSAEDIVLLETMKAADKDHRVFKLQFEAGEFDMVIYDQKENSCEIFEIKHSSKQVPFQYRHLVDEDKCQRTERRFGPIHGRYILYRGEDAQMENGVQYWNVENYLKALPTLDIVQVQEIGMQSIEPTL